MSRNSRRVRGDQHAHQRSFDYALTFQLLVQSPAGGDRKGTNELFKVDSPVLVLVKHVEDVVRELSRITEGEELFVDLAKFLLVELA